MENLYLSSDEPILLTSQNIVINGVRHEAVLTDKRLVVVRRDDPKAPHQAIPLAAIRSAIAGENTLHEPTITLSLATLDGVLNTVELVFIRLSSEHKNSQYDEWVARLKEHINVSTAGFLGPSSDQNIPGTAATGMSHVPAYIFHPPKPLAAPQESGLKKIAITIIVIAALMVAVFAGSQLLSSKPTEGMQPSMTPDVETSPAMTITTTSPTPLPTLTVQPSMTLISSPQVIVPSSGIWVRIQYPGIFTGSVGTSGRMREVNSTGDRFYQIPVMSGVIEAEIQKTEKNADELAITVYKDGVIVKRVNTTAPAGSIILNAAV
ncbi:MAG: hypothetical protein A4E35_02262 [Methanoregula sp. PtaU1.Bin051]|nr:MAG: hypothetical protein A4E35_02262 [Methanoregula sp. PtaU1.Bin051]